MCQAKSMVPPSLHFALTELNYAELSLLFFLTDSIWFPYILIALASFALSCDLDISI